MTSIELDHFGVDVTDLDRAERFYAGVLGMVVSRRMDDQILLHCGNQMLALFLNPHMKPTHPDAVDTPVHARGYLLREHGEREGEPPSRFAGRRGRREPL